MTSTGTVMGTPHYMSPEQVRGQKADARSDVFALGCVYYELLTGRKPFDAESMHGVLFKVMQEEPTPLAEVAPDVPHPLMHVVERALSKDPAERFQSAGEMLSALRLARAAGATAAGAPRPERPAGERTVVSTPQAPRDPARSASRSGTRAPGSTVSRVSPSHGTRNLLIAFVAGLAVVVVAVLALRPMLGGAREPEPPPQVAALVQAALATRVEVAQRRLDSGDYAAAVREAESALKIVKDNAEAKAILAEASDLVKRSDEAAAALEQAQAKGGDVAAAAFELMKVDPAHPDAQKALASAGASFRPRAEEAQRLAADAEKAADAAGGSRQPGFSAARTLADQGRQALQSGQFVNAARRFLEARIRFERAGRAAGRS
jgi:tetratricopeptide (TPR) repeat protein